MEGSDSRLYSGTTFVSWNYCEASVIVEFSKGLRFGRGYVRTKLTDL